MITFFSKKVIGRTKWTRTTDIRRLISRSSFFASLRLSRPLHKALHSPFGLHSLDESTRSPSYIFSCSGVFCPLVGPSGLEPPTSCLSGTRSNLLSYDPMWLAWFSHHSVIFRVKDGRFRPYLLMSALSYLPVQSPVKYFHHCRA